MLATAERQTSKHRPLAPTTLRPPQLLCVDDDPDFHTSFEVRMRDFDVSIVRAFYGMQGIIEAANTLPDLILLDQAMPNGDGEYLLECIKQNTATAHIPVIVLTGMRDPTLRHRLVESGADVYLNKPLHFDELLHHISRYVDIRRRGERGR